MNPWLVVVLAGLGSLALRLSFILAASFVRLPTSTQRLADLVFPAAMAAILGSTVHALATTAGLGQLAVLAAGAIVTAVVSRLTGSILGALAAGLAIVLVVSAITGTPGTG